MIYVTLPVEIKSNKVGEKEDTAKPSEEGSVSQDSVNLLQTDVDDFVEFDG